MTEYTYAENYFTNGLNLKQLHAEILNAISTPSQFDGILQEDGNVIFKFTTSLSGPDFIIFEDILDAHNPSVEYNPDTIFKDEKLLLLISNKIYKVYTSVYYPGKSVAPVQYIKIFSWISTGTGSYDIRIVDVLNNTVIAEGTLNNTTPEHSLIEIEQNNLSTTPSQWEVHLKVTSSGTLYAQIDNIVIY